MGGNLRLIKRLSGPTRRWVQFVGVLLTTLLLGCPGALTQHTATPIPTGEVEFGVVGGAGGAVSAEEGVLLPTVEFALRYGISERADFGVVVTGPMVTTDLNLALVNTASFALSLDPTVSASYFAVDDSSVFTFIGLLKVLADVVKTEPVTMVVGLTGGYGYISLDSVGEDEVTGVGHGALWGGTVGAKFRASENLALMPSFDVLVDYPTTGVIYRAALGFHF